MAREGPYTGKLFDALIMIMLIVCLYMWLNYVFNHAKHVFFLRFLDLLVMSI